MGRWGDGENSTSDSTTPLLPGSLTKDATTKKRKRGTVPQFAPYVLWRENPIILRDEELKHTERFPSGALCFFGGQLGISWKNANENLIFDVPRSSIPGTPKLTNGSKDIKCRIPVMGGTFQPLQVDDETQLHVIKSLLELCDIAEELVGAEAVDSDDTRCDRLRSQLNDRYNEFASEYGYLSNCKSYYSGIFWDSRMCTYLAQLESEEVYPGEKKKKERRIIKAEIFTKRINYPPKEVSGQIFFEEDLDIRIAHAFSWCMGFRGTVSLDEIAEKAGVSLDAAERSLLDQSLIYREWVGIQHQPWWEVLDVFPNCTLEELKAAYRKKSRQYHPDLNPSSAATLMMQRINDAYEQGKIEVGG